MIQLIWLEQSKQRGLREKFRKKRKGQVRAKLKGQNCFHESVGTLIEDS